MYIHTHLYISTDEDSNTGTAREEGVKTAFLLCLTQELLMGLGVGFLKWQLCA